MLQDSARLMAIAQQAHSLPGIVAALHGSAQFADPIFEAAPASIGRVGKKLSDRVSGWLPVQALAASNRKKSGAAASSSLLCEPATRVPPCNCDSMNRYSVSKLAATDVVQVAALAAC
jgi:hypothetical protein